MLEKPVDGTAQFVVLDGANHLSGARAMWWVLRHYPALRREMKSTDGYLQHRVAFSPPYTLILTSWWADEKCAYRFAHRPVHLKFWQWAARNPENTRGGWLAVYRYERGGPLWGDGVPIMRRGLEALVPFPNHGDPTPTPDDRRRARKSKAAQHAASAEGGKADASAPPVSDAEHS